MEIGVILRTVMRNSGSCLPEQMAKGQVEGSTQPEVDMDKTMGHLRVVER